MKKLFNVLFKQKYAFDILLLLLIGLIPLLWFGSGELVMGHDSGWTLVPEERFFDRFSAWTGFEFGSDQSLFIGSVTIYVLPALLSSLNFSIYQVQQLTYVYWFFAIAVSMYVCIITILKTSNNRLIALGAALFYSVNHYTLQAWTVAELSKFSAMIFFPITLALLWSVFEKKLALRYAVVLFAFVSVIFNGGGGSGIPLYAGMFLSLGILFLYELLILKCSIKLLIKTYLLFILSFTLINAYWILPMVSVIQSQYSPFASSGGPEGAVAWTNVISGNTSIINLLRLQGFSSWYDSPDHAFAYVYLNNPLFIFSSYVFGVLAILSIIFTKQKQEKKIIPFIFLVFVFSLVFAGGTHSPFGFIYEFLMKHVFGFAIFRTAFYKFGYALWFAVAILASYSIIKISERIHKKLSLFAFIIFCSFVLLYHNQYFTGVFFNILGDFKTKIQLSNDLVDSKTYVKRLPDDIRIMLLPPPSPINGQTDIYVNGYFSRTPLPFQISQKSIVSNRESNTTAQENLTESFYSHMRNKDYSRAKNILSELGVTHLLLRNDVLLNHKTYRVEDPALYEQRIREVEWISLEKDFGDWEIYSVSDAGDLFSVVSPNINYISGEESVFIKNSNLASGKIFTPILFRKDFFQDKDFPSVMVNECETCEYPGVRRLPSVEDVKILPTSPFYFISQARERKNILNSQYDPYLHFGYLFFYAEKHSVEIALLASQYFEVDALKLDQQQRYDIVDSYIQTLQDSFKEFKKLSYEQQVSVAKEYKSSLESQRERLREARQSNFFNEIFSMYYKAYAEVNEIINSEEVKSAIREKDLNNQYRINISEAGDYRLFTTVNGSEYLLNGKIVSLSEIQSLDKGDHVLQERRVKDVIHNEKEIELNNDQLVYELTLKDLEPSELYGINFSYHIEQGPALRFEVVNDLGIDTANIILEHTSRSYWIPFSNFFRTSNYVGGAYKIRIFAEGEDDLTALSYIKDFSVELLKLPYVFVEQSSSQKDSRLPSVTVDKISKTEYRVHIKNAKDPYVLNFKQTFSSSWRGEIEGDGEIIHFPYNIAFNGWYINKMGDYVITLSYKIDNYYKVGAVITVITSVSLLLWLVILIMKKYDKKN